MTFWYSGEKDGFAVANCTKWNESNSRIEFSEFGIKDDNDFVYLYGYATDFTNIRNYKNQDWKFEPQKIVIKLAKKDYTKSYQDKVTEVKQSAVEKFAVDILANWDKSKLYKGRIYFQHLQQYEWYVDGKLDDSMKSAFVAGMFQTSYLETQPEKIKLDEFAPSSNSANSSFKGGNVRGQTEYEKLKDKEKFMIEFFMSAFPNEKIENVADIIKLSANDNFWTATTLFNELFGSSVTKK